MVNLKDPVHLGNSVQAYIVCAHIIFGIYFWEWVNTLDFDFLYIRRQKRMTLAAVSFFLTRYLCLCTWIIGIVICNAFKPIDCRAWTYALTIAAYGTAASTSMLLLLRVSAVSSRNWYIISFLIVFYGAEWGTVIWGMYNSDGIYIAAYHICSGVGIQSHQINTVLQFSFDLTCLALMMFFLLRSHRAQPGSLWGFMLRQGMAYTVCISVAYIPVVTLLFLDLNDAISQTINCFGLLIITLCATRMHRNLVLYHEPSSKIELSRSTNLVNATTGGFMRRPPQDALSVTVTVDKYNDRHDDPIATHKSDAYPMSDFNRPHMGYPKKEQLGQV